MCTLHRGYAMQKALLWFVFLALFSLFRPSPGLSESPGRNLIKSGSVMIEGKTADAVVVGERHFLVTEATTIRDVKGKTIDLSALPIPCKAEISYRLRMDEDPVALSISIKQIPKGASEIWPLSGSER